METNVACIVRGNGGIERHNYASMNAADTPLPVRYLLSISVILMQHL